MYYWLSVKFSMFTQLCPFLFVFLVADQRLYKRLCPSVRRSIGRSVTLESKSGKTRISAPAHPSATGIGRVTGLVFSQKIVNVTLDCCGEKICLEIVQKQEIQRLYLTKEQINKSPTRFPFKVAVPKGALGPMSCRNMGLNFLLYLFVYSSVFLCILPLTGHQRPKLAL